MPGLSEAVPGDVRDTSTPRAMATSLGEFILGDALPEEKREIITEMMLGNLTGDELIRAGVPRRWWSRPWARWVRVVRAEPIGEGEAHAGRRMSSTSISRVISFETSRPSDRGEGEDRMARRLCGDGFVGRVGGHVEPAPNEPL